MKHFVCICFLSVACINAWSQHFLPVELTAEPEHVRRASYGGISLDAGNQSEFLSSFSNTAQTGFVYNLKYQKKPGNNGQREVNVPISIDLNPIIIGWSPFTWNKLVSQPVDSFSVNKLPFSEDAFLHIGIRRNTLMKAKQGVRNRENERQLFGLFAEGYWRPYNIDKDNINYRFQVFNVTSGFQYCYLVKEPKENQTSNSYFLIGISGQINFMFVNESDAYINSFKNCTGVEHYDGKNYWGPGFKIFSQITKYLNLYVEFRQYYAMDGNYVGKKFTQEPIILVGALPVVPWSVNKSNKNNDISKPSNKPNEEFR